MGLDHGNEIPPLHRGMERMRDHVGLVRLRAMYALNDRKCRAIVCTKSIGIVIILRHEASSICQCLVSS